MEFLKRIDFENHNGVYLPMINDVGRNHFYDKILTEVCDQHCVEIGFGTGFLSMLALKHGARSIVAYESDPDRYRLGCEVIKVLKLQDRITLINQRYDHTCNHPASVIFTETVDDNIWGEGLFNSFPRQPDKRFLPGQYFLEIYAIPISADIAYSLIQANEKNQFAPGVDVDPRFVSYVNLLLSKKYNKPIKSKTGLPTGVTELTPMPTYIDWATNNTYAGRYVIDANTLFVDNPVRELQVDTAKQPVLIVPRAGMQHNNERLYLDTGHWGLPANPAVINSPNSRVTVQHDLLLGKISYTIQEKT
jgi:predicted RNA methylase